MFRNKLVIGILVVISLTYFILAHYIPRFPGDLPVSVGLQSFQNGFLDMTMEGLGYITDSWRAAIIVVAASAFVWFRFGRFDAALLALSGVVSVLSKVIKLIIDRPRPSSELVNVLIEETGNSFPSGHALFAVAVFGMLAYLILKHQTRLRQRMTTLVLTAVLVLWIGVSRVYLGVHWMSDVIGGYLTGGIFLFGLLQLEQVSRLHPGIGVQRRSI